MIHKNNQKSIYLKFFFNGKIYVFNPWQAQHNWTELFERILTLTLVKFSNREGLAESIVCWNYTQEFYSQSLNIYLRERTLI